MKKMLFALTLFVALLGGNYMVYHLILPIRIAFHLTITLAILYGLYRFGIPEHPLSLAALAMLVSVIVSIPAALDPRMALENGWSAFNNLLILLMLIQLCRAGFGPGLLNAHFTAGALVAILAIAEWLTTHARPQGLFFNI